MGEENKSKFYILNNNWKYQRIGLIKKIPKAALGGIINNNENLATIGEYSQESIVTLKTRVISKKRFIKLLMGEGYQKKEAIRIHNEYINKYKSRDGVQSLLFIYIKGKERKGILEVKNYEFKEANREKSIKEEI